MSVPPLFGPSLPDGTPRWLGTRRAALILLVAPLQAAAAWQIDQSAYNAYLCQQVRVAQACMAPARTGHFATRSECESARTRGRLGGDWQWLNRTRCVELPDAGTARRATPPAVAGSGQPQDESAARDAARFEQQRRELLARLKTPEGGSQQTSPAGSAGVLRELQCSAGWALSAARDAADGKLGDARRAAQRSADALGAGIGNCPPAPIGPIPVPQPARDEPPSAETYRHIIEQAQAIRSRLETNRQAIDTTRARRARTEQALAEALRKAGAEAGDDDARRRANEALAAVERLERELAQLDAQLAQAESEQRQLTSELDALERKYREAQAQPAPAHAEAGK